MFEFDSFFIVFIVFKFYFTSFKHYICSEIFFTMQEILTKTQIDQKIMRLAHQILENSSEEKHLFLAGIGGNGAEISRRLAVILKENSTKKIEVFTIHLTKENPLTDPITITIDETLLTNSYVVLIDDVVNSGLTMQYALVKLLGSPVREVKTVALVDRTHRRYPIKCDYVGITLSTTLQDRVELAFEKDNYYAYLV